MGMFDYLKISTKLLPLSESEKKAIGENHDWQTKDFECILSTAEITDEGNLRFLTFKYEWDDNAECAMTKITGEKGALVTKDERWIDINHHGYINFCSYINKILYEFNAKFTDGKLISIERISNE